MTLSRLAAWASRQLTESLCDRATTYNAMGSKCDVVSPASINRSTETVWMP
jgi:hypothetical protein